MFDVVYVKLSFQASQTITTVCVNIAVSCELLRSAFDLKFFGPRYANVLIGHITGVACLSVCLSGSHMLLT